MNRKKTLKKKSRAPGQKRPGQAAASPQKRGGAQKILINWILPAAVSAALTACVFVVMRGFPLFGLPKAEQVASVRITDIRLQAQAREITEAGDIEKAVKMANFLNYKLGAPQPGDPFLQVTYRLKDGGEITLSANERTVFWKGKSHPVKQEGVFVKVAEGLFFFEQAGEG